VIAFGWERGWMGEHSKSGLSAPDRGAHRRRLDLGRFVRDVRGPLLNLAHRIVRDPIEAEDVVIEVLARLIPRIDEFDSTGHFVGYARSAVRNQAVDRVRSRSFRDARRALRDTDSLDRQRPDDSTHPVELVPDHHAGPEQQIVASERRRSVREAVDSLDEPRRTVVSMFYDQDRSYSEIADELGVSSATVKRHLGAARLALAVCLRDLQREDHVA
jgi:RNA polymerase sigma factor (sigma-70 family)